MLNNKVIFLMWLYCVLSRHLALCNNCLYKMNTRDGDRTCLWGRPPPRVCVWTQHLSLSHDLKAQVPLNPSLRGTCPQLVWGSSGTPRVAFSNQELSAGHWRWLSSAQRGNLWGFCLSLIPATPWAIPLSSGFGLEIHIRFPLEEKKMVDYLLKRLK